jgi:MYXO-CTERM domain-containing protein
MIFTARRAALLAHFACAAWTGIASASPSFPGRLQEELDMPCAPQCTLCHRDTNGGQGTAVQPFGEAMKNAGLRLKQPDLIPVALNKLAEGGYDSDGDGVTDVNELKEGRNPNQPGEGVLCPTYGCTAGGSTKPPRTPLAALIAGLALAIVRRKRRKASKS